MPEGLLFTNCGAIAQRFIPRVRTRILQAAAVRMLLSIAPESSGASESGARPADLLVQVFLQLQRQLRQGLRLQHIAWVEEHTGGAE